MSFEAEAINSGGEKFATFKVNASSLHYPLGVVYWGADSGSIQSTDTGAPFPVRLFGNDSGQPVFTVNNSATQLYVQADSNNPVFVRDENSTTVTVTGYVAPSTTITITNIASNDTVVTVTGYVAPSTTVTITGYVAPSTTAAISSVSGVVSVEPTSSAKVALRTTDVANGMLTSEINLSSLAQTIMDASGMLYGWSLSNESTSANVWLKAFEDDSGGVTLGTTSPKFNVMIPFGGGREAFFPTGIPMSSGMSVAAAATAASTAHDAPSSTGWATIYYDPSS